MWPRRYDPYILYDGDEGFDRAVKELRAVSQPSPRDYELAKSLIYRDDTNTREALQAVCQSACTWNDIT